MIKDNNIKSQKTERGLLIYLEPDLLVCHASFDGTLFVGNEEFVVVIPNPY